MKSLLVLSGLVAALAANDYAKPVCSPVCVKCVNFNYCLECPREWRLVHSADATWCSPEVTSSKSDYHKTSKKSYSKTSKKSYTDKKVAYKTDKKVAYKTDKKAYEAKTVYNAKHY